MGEEAAAYLDMLPVAHANLRKRRGVHCPELLAVDEIFCEAELVVGARARAPGAEVRELWPGRAGAAYYWHSVGWGAMSRQSVVAGGGQARRKKRKERVEKMMERELGGGPQPKGQNNRSKVEPGEGGQAWAE